MADYLATATYPDAKLQRRQLWVRPHTVGASSALNIHYRRFSYSQIHLVPEQHKLSAGIEHQHAEVKLSALPADTYSMDKTPSRGRDAEHGRTFATWHLFMSASCPEDIALRSFWRKLGFSVIDTLPMKCLVHYR